MHIIVPKELKLLGRVIDAQGIWMDTEKVDSLELEDPYKLQSTMQIHRNGWVLS